MPRLWLWWALLSACLSSLDAAEFVKKTADDGAPSGSGVFLNLGQPKKYKDTTPKLHNSVLKSKIELLGEIFKQHVNFLRSVGNKQVELVFLVDSSASVGIDNFHSELKFVKKLLADFTVSQDTTRVAVITFASKNQVVRHVDHISKPSEENHKCGLLHLELPAVNYSGGGTYTRGALLEAQEVLKYARPSAAKAIFLITDGFSNGGDPVPTATELKRGGARIFTFGVAHGNTRELHDVASSPGREHSFILDSFGEFEALVRRALHQDLKAGSYQLLDSQSSCNHLCANRSSCCDEHAQCACGVDTGHFACLCPTGFFGSGLQGSCQACPDGTYSDETSPGDISLCKPCPDPNHVTLPAATSKDHCLCKTGFRARAGRCQVMTCPRLAPPPKGFFVKRTCSNVLNAACGVRCAVGYRLVGSSIRLCREDGTWSGEPALCRVKTCGPLPAPVDGNVTCSRVDLAVDTECTFACAAGSHLVGSKHRTCLPLGRWDGLHTACKAVTCPALPRLLHGTVTPAECVSTKQQHGAACQLTCDAGFKLVGPSGRSCGGRVGSWSGDRSHSRCVDETPPSLECPPGIDVNTDLDEKFATVEWVVPNVTDNSGKPPNVWTKPAISLPMKAKIGVTQITYVATDASRNKARCTFSVTVRDVQPPHVDSCEDPPTFLSGSPDTPLAWDPPTFSDNSGLPVKVVRSPDTDVFGYGATPVTYVAMDKFGNNNTCVLNVTVQENVCVRPEAPHHGLLDCTQLPDALHCTLTCDEGYAFALAPRDFFCTYDSGGAMLSPDPAVDPVPDCSVNVLPNSVSEEGTVTLEGEGGACSDPAILALVEQQVEVALVAAVDETCDNELRCDVRNVTLSCEEILSSIEEASNSISRRRRELPGRRNESDTVYLVGSTEGPKLARSEIQVRFQMIGQVRSNTSSEILGPGVRGVKTSLDRLANQDVTLAAKKKRLKIKRVGFRPEPNFGCPSGSVLRGKMCVKCPVGTRLNLGLRACESCPVGEYQPTEGQLECLPCPPGSSTRRIHARSIRECKPLCPPGSYGRQRKLSPNVPGLAPCTSCETGRYQPLAGRLGCEPCPPGYTTSRRGAVSDQQCAAMCSEGHFSESGHAPCHPCLGPGCERDACALGPCLNGGSCVDVGLGRYACDCRPGHVGSACEVEVNACDSSPCLHGATCRPGPQGANATCECAPGYTGDNCQTDVDECASCPCLHGATCVDLVDGFHCLCAQGYNGSTCELDANECSPAPCGEHGVCVDSVANYSCDCSAGHTGRHCEVKPADPCASQPCHQGATCSPRDDTYSCSCPPGYEGPNCETDVDECAPRPCLNEGRCEDLVGSFSCICAPGYSGPMCADALPTEFSLEFPTAGTTDYVAVKGPARPLAQATVCLWLKTADRFNYGTVFSYATEEHDNSFTLTDYNGFVLYVGGERVITDVIANDGVWHFLCAVWSSAEGEWAIYIDHRLGDQGRGLAKGAQIPANGSLVLGQEQDRLGGGFSQSESFMGHLSGVAMWDRVLEVDEVRRLATSCEETNTRQGNVFQWIDFLSGIRGDLKIEKSTFCSGCPQLPALFNGFVNVTSDGSVANYACRPGYNLRWRDDSFASVYPRKCLKQGEWEGETPICIRVSCGFPGYFPRGVVLGRSYRYGDAVAYVCGVGYELVGDPVRVCSEDGRWGGLVPTCSGKTCPVPEPPADGKIVGHFESDERQANASGVVPQYGHQVEFECNEGFAMNGSNVLTCLETGQWDETTPNCKPTGCPEPEPPANGTTAEDAPERYEFGARVREQCNSGFRPMGEARTCLPPGVWSGPPLTCAPTCDPDRIPFYSQFFAAPDDFRIEIFERDIGNGLLEVTGDLATFRCKEGFELGAGPTEATLQWACLPDGQWEAASPRSQDAVLLGTLDTLCRSVDANCSRPAVPVNGYLQQEVAELSQAGTMVHFTCRLGYTLQGPSQAVCQHNGRWSGANLTTCEPVECRRPTTPANTVAPSLPVAPIYGHLVTFHCAEGFTSYGELSSRCQANGRWSRVRGKCSRVACGKPMVAGGAIVNGNSYLFEDKITFHCPPGMKMKGGSVLTCLKSGSWNGSAVCY